MADCAAHAHRVSPPTQENTCRIEQHPRRSTLTRHANRAEVARESYASTGRLREESPTGRLNDRANALLRRSRRTVSQLLPRREHGGLETWPATASRARGTGSLAGHRVAPIRTEHAVYSGARETSTRATAVIEVRRALAHVKIPKKQCGDPIVFALTRRQGSDILDRGHSLGQG